MKYLKTFEFYKTDTGQYMDYTTDDIVVCVDDKNSNLSLKNGEKYKVLKIYKMPEDKFLKKDFLRVYVQNLETGEVSKGWESTRFKLEIEDTADKYNL